MSVFVLDDLCFSLSSLPPNEAMVAVVSKDMMDNYDSKGGGLLVELSELREMEDDFVNCPRRDL